MIRPEEPATKPGTLVAWYDAHAGQLADDYEGLDASVAHRAVFERLRGSPPLRILDVGAGTGRDAAALAAVGHRVTAIEPSATMRRLAQTLHADKPIAWVSDHLPGLARSEGQYDLVWLSAVWMHVPPAERERAFRRIAALTAPARRIYMTLRLGALDGARPMWKVDAGEVRQLAEAEEMGVIDFGSMPELLGRADVRWQALLLSK